MAMNRWLGSVGLALVLVSSTGCVIRARARVSTVGVVSEAPPAPQVETYGTRAGHVWVAGRWNYNGNRWVWVGGHWERARANYQWRDGYWEQRAGQWHWVDGQWTAGGNINTTPPAINSPGGVTVGQPPPPPPVVTSPPPAINSPGGVSVGASLYPTAPPPGLRAETAGTKAGYVWITGRWDWRAGQWAWVDGHWERAKANQVWVAGRWELQGSYYVWIDGSWQAAPAAGPVKRDHRR